MAPRCQSRRSQGESQRSKDGIDSNNTTTPYPPACRHYPSTHNAPTHPADVAHSGRLRPAARGGFRILQGLRPLDGQQHDSAIALGQHLTPSAITDPKERPRPDKITTALQMMTRRPSARAPFRGWEYAAPCPDPRLMSMIPRMQRRITLQSAMDWARDLDFDLATISRGVLQPHSSVFPSLQREGYVGRPNLPRRQRPDNDY